MRLTSSPTLPIVVCYLALLTQQVASFGCGTLVCHETKGGKENVAIGWNTEASGVQGDTAMGYYTKASGGFSTAMGYGTTASQLYTTAMGQSTEAFHYCEH